MIKVAQGILVKEALSPETYARLILRGLRTRGFSPIGGLTAASGSMYVRKLPSSLVRKGTSNQLLRMTGKLEDRLRKLQGVGSTSSLAQSALEPTVSKMTNMQGKLQGLAKDITTGRLGGLAGRGVAPIPLVDGIA